MLATCWLTSKPGDTLTWPEDRQVEGQTDSSDDDCVDIFVSQSVRYIAQTLWSSDAACVYVY
jgi:hypothetical protein